MHDYLIEGSEPNLTIDAFPIENEGPIDAEDQDNEWSEEESSIVASSLQLARQAADGMAPSTAANEELAHDMGYNSVRSMMEQTEIVPLPSGAYMYLTTDSDNYWVAWRDKPIYDIQRFDSRQQAISCLQEWDDWMAAED